MSGPILNRRLVLEDPQHVPDGAGGYDRTWMPLGELWAEIQAKAGRAGLNGTAAVSVNAFEVLVRGAPVGAPSRPRPHQRFRDGARIFQIVSVVEHDTGGRFLRCVVEEEAVR